MPPADATDPDKPPAPSSGTFADLFAGAGLGLLLGTILGLSVTPVVSAVVGGITAILAVFLGLDGSNADPDASLRRIRLNGVRIGSFGFATVLGVLLGLFLRNGFLFDASLEDHMNRWQGFPDTVAQQMVIYERTGLSPKRLIFPEGETEVELNETAVVTRSNVLVSALTGARDLCRELDPEEFGNRVGPMIQRYKDLGAEGPDYTFFADMATQIEKLQTKEEQLTMFTEFNSFLCRLRGAGIQ